MESLFIHKIGYDHHQEWKNCQDFGFANRRLKCVLDGCSEGSHSEAGVKLFAHLFAESGNAEESFDALLPLFKDYEAIKNHLLFTILFVAENEDAFQVRIAGDGYIIKIDRQDQVSFEKIDYDNCPPYYAYNFIDNKRLTKYADGVVFEERLFAKTEFKKIGVASDGLSYILKSPFKDEFIDYLRNNKKFAILRLLNREHKWFKDDIAVAL